MCTAVKVHSTQCPTLDSLSVRSFTLTASTQQEEEEEGREEEVGVFSRVSNAMFDTHLCRNRKVWGQVMLLQLRYGWTAASKYEYSVIQVDQRQVVMSTVGCMLLM